MHVQDTFGSVTMNQGDDKDVNDSDYFITIGRFEDNH